MRVTANGRGYDVPAGITVAAFIRERSLDPQYVVVERNGEAVERSRYDELRLEPDDRLELVRAVAGGSGEGETVLSEPAAPSSLAAWRRRRLAAARLYVVTDARQERGDLAEFLEEILDAGVDVVQLRE
jgi:thiamine biosynthesis protein ThiS